MIKLFLLGFGILVVSLILLVFERKALRKNKLKNLFHIILFILYILIILKMTLFRSVELRRVVWTPFKSLRTLFGPRHTIGASAIRFFENIYLFIPLGFLCKLHNKKHSKKGIVLFGFLFSLFIEVSQYIFSRGCFEVDDLIANTLGCYLGCLLYHLLYYVVEKKGESICQMIKTHWK